ncbi:hypothetical protein D9M72_582220 [compost metagenome]
MAVDERPDDRNDGERGDTEDQQHPVRFRIQARRLQERHDVGVKTVVSENDGKHHEQHRPDPGQPEHR